MYTVSTKSKPTVFFAITLKIVQLCKVPVKSSPPPGNLWEGCQASH